MRSKPITPGVFIFDFVAGNGVPFRALVIAARTEGPNRHRKPAGSDRAIIEFYDRRSLIDGEHGQFTAGYYDVDTILGRDEFGSEADVDAGLWLHGGVPAWVVDADSMGRVRGWLAALVDGGHL